MSTSYILPLKAPTPLPASGVDTVTFKVWRNTLIAHIQQDANHHFFMPDGLYDHWRAAEYGTRIQQLHDEDPEKITLDGKLERLGEDVHRAEITKLLGTRNAPLAKYITHIATLCHHTENDDVTNHSTSLQWIFDYLLKHYGLETKGANFMDISKHSYKQGTPFQTFYKQYRASFVDNLRRQGDTVLYKNDLVLTEDEKLSPSFENAIILWSLEKIDPRLPAKVKKNYGHQMTGDVTLKDIQPVVFENIPGMIDELDQAQTAKAFAVQSLEDDTSLNAVNFQNRSKAQPRMFNQRKPVRDRQPFSLSRNNQVQKQTAKLPSISNKFCRICSLAGSSPQVYLSHEIGDCGRLSAKDLDSLKNSMMLNGIIDIPSQEPELDEPSFDPQPGWDDLDLHDQDPDDHE